MYWPEEKEDGAEWVSDNPTELAGVTNKLATLLPTRLFNIYPLTGGFSDVVTEARSRTDLTPETVDGHLSLTPAVGAKFKRKSVDEKPLVTTQARKHFCSISIMMLMYLLPVSKLYWSLSMPLLSLSHILWHLGRAESDFIFHHLILFYDKIPPKYQV